MWDRYGQKRGIGQIPMHSIIEHEHVLWAAAVDNGLLRYNSEQDTWVRVPVKGDSPIITVAALSDGSLWVGSRDFVARSSDTGATWTIIGTTEAKQIHSAPNLIVEDSEGRIWVGSGEGLTYYDGTHWQTP